MQRAGIRAFVGKLSMDLSARPTYVETSVASALSSAISFVGSCHGMVSRLPAHERLLLAALLRVVKREGVEEVRWGDVRHSFPSFLVRGS